jgi:hypothetical protein
VLAAQTKDDEPGLRYRFSYSALADLRRQGDRFSDLLAFNAHLGGLRTAGRVVTPFLYSCPELRVIPFLVRTRWISF